MVLVDNNADNKNIDYPEDLFIWKAEPFERSAYTGSNMHLVLYF